MLEIRDNKSCIMTKQGWNNISQSKAKKKKKVQKEQKKKGFNFIIETSTNSSVSANHP